MNALVRLAPLTAVDIFAARCEARTILYAVGELGLHEAVDVLQEAAVRIGLVAAVGQDAVQDIIATAFEEYGG